MKPPIIRLVAQVQHDGGAGDTEHVELVGEPGSDGVWLKRYDRGVWLRRWSPTIEAAPGILRAWLEEDDV